MPNRCTEIRKIVADCLTETFKDNVFNGKYTPIQKEKHFPSISILTPSEKNEVISKSPKLFERTTELYIILFTRLHDNGEEERDNLMQFIEGKINNIDHSDFEFEFNSFDTDVNTDSVHHSIVTTIKYNCIYNSSELKEREYTNLNKFLIEVTNG